MPEPRKKFEIIELEIADLAFGGRGIARQDNYVWFVDGGIPGQKVRARTYRIAKQYGEARAVETLSPSPDQVDPVCPHFGVCGGCQLQHLRYEAQIAAKTRQVRDLLQRIGGFPEPDVRPTLPSASVTGYRNKMEFTFSDLAWKPAPPAPDGDASGASGTEPGWALGLHVPGRFDKVLNIESCPLQSDRANAVLKSVHSLVAASGLPGYGARSHRGVWRFLVLREAKATGDLMVHCITSGQNFQESRAVVDRMAADLVRRHPFITTFTHSVTDRLSQVAAGESERVLHGDGRIREKLGDRVFEISPGSFFQTHTAQAVRLFDTVAGLAGWKGNERVYDLYCGTGAIGICLSDKVGEVIGIESVEPAVRNAVRNAELNGLMNISFVLGDLKDALRDKGFRERFGPPDSAVVDPPRAGMHPDALEDLIRLAPASIVYVSCNPPILARDAKTLCDRGYVLGPVQPVDLFPHTGHVEVVAVFNRVHSS
ncbi:23S rRNA (uracil(1939)-C(5))-methyltransferase RlmD [bacterium]|nr:23S rRNA (uracil(1939)-C(5))-methyltransferase RlmD [bacterium]